MSRILVLMLMISTYALASGGSAEHASSDIMQRTVNFVIFVALIWYLVAAPVKNYFAGRSKGIANELQKVQDKLNETIALKKDALAKISEAEKFKEELIISSKKENKIINDNIMLQCDSELEILAKHHVSIMELEQRKMLKNVVENVLDDVLNKSKDNFDKESMANIILKKVA